MQNSIQNADTGKSWQAAETGGDGVFLRLPAERLKKRSEFVAIRKGNRKACDFFTVQTRKRSPSDEENPSSAPRIGFTVTKKTGNSVVRNRIKRRLRAIAGICDAKGLFQPNTDYVIIARRAALTADFSDLETSLMSVAKKAAQQDGQNKRSTKRV